MRIEIVVVGNELLGGDLADTNTARLGELLRAQGLRPSRGQTVPDEERAIVDALALAASRADLVLVTGGLGPTDDDLTVASAARWAGRPLIEDARQLGRIRERFAKRGLPFTANNARQARVPEGAEALDNPVGTAPGVRMTHGGTTLFFFPGVPRELERLAEDHLLPWLREHAPVRPASRHAFKTFGRTESQVATLLEGLEQDPRLHVAYRAHFPEIHVTLHVEEADPAAARALLGRVAGEVRGRLGDLVFTEDAAESFAEALARRMGPRGETLAVAESCTGGLLSKLITDVPGVSAWFVEGAVTYANDAKVRRLGVSEEVLRDHGAVSEACARAMAEGARAAAGTTWALAVTGIAGPGGGGGDKPVGTVHLALAGPGGTEHRARVLPFDRRGNRTVSAYMALDLLRRQIDHEST